MLWVGCLSRDRIRIIDTDPWQKLNGATCQLMFRRYAYLQSQFLHCITSSCLFLHIIFAHFPTILFTICTFLTTFFTVSMFPTIFPMLCILSTWFFGLYTISSTSLRCGHFSQSAIFKHDFYVGYNFTYFFRIVFIFTGSNFVFFNVVVMSLTKVKALTGWFVVPSLESSLSCLNVPLSLL